MKPLPLAILGLLSIITGFVLKLIIPDLRAYALIFLAIGVILIVIGAVIDFRQIRVAVDSQRGRLGLSLSIRIICVCGSVILINAISHQAFHRYDITGVSQFTLTAQTREAIEAMDEKVEVLCFFSSSVAPSVVDYSRSLLEEYQIYTDKISVDYIDPELNPDLVRRHQLESFETYYGVLLFRGAEGEKRVYGPQIEQEAEHAFTNAILEVSGERQKTLYFTYGHGENVSETALGILQDHLYSVREVNLAETGAVPEDASVLVVSGPKADFSHDEQKAMETYMEAGGSALVMLNPGYDGNLSAFLESQSMETGNGTVIDPSSYVVPRKNVLLVGPERNLFNLSQLFFPDAVAVKPMADLPEGRVLMPMVWTMDGSWEDIQASENQVFAYDPETDKEGIFAVGLVGYSELDTEGTRIAVLGDSDFISETNILNGDNASFFLLAVNWLIDGKTVVDIERNVLPYRRLIMSSEEARFMAVTSIGLIPCLLLISGVYVWWRKR